MDIERFKAAICEARRFTPTGDGFHVLADNYMPSGGAIIVHFQFRRDVLFAHDGGAAFDELARHGGTISTRAGVRRLLAKTGFRLTEDGLIWRERIKPEHCAGAIALVADASQRAASFLLERATFPRSQPLDKRLKDALGLRFSEGRPNFTFTGRNRQHTFDFGVLVDDKMLLAEAVSPDSKSIASAVLKAMDAKAAGPNVVPIFAYDPADEWTSPALGMLELVGGVRVEIDDIRDAPLRLAA